MAYGTSWEGSPESEPEDALFTWKNDKTKFAIEVGLLIYLFCSFREGTFIFIANICLPTKLSQLLVC